MTTTDTQRRIYVACLASYNEGRLHGRWIDASSDVDEMDEQVQEMLASSQLDFGRKAEEYAIHDYEGYGSGSLIGEYSGLAFVAQLEELLEECESNGIPEEAAVQYLADRGSGDLPDADTIQDAYCGQWDSGAAYAEDFYESTGSVTDDFPLLSYLDWEAVWRGEFDCAGYSISDEGYVWMPV